MNSPVSGKPVKGASLSEHVSIRGTREGFRGYRGNSRCISRIGSRGRGGHNNSSSSKQESSTVEESGPKTVASCGEHKGLAACSIGDSTVRLESGHELPIMTTAWDNSSSSSKLDNMPVVDGFVENMKVKVLRDVASQVEICAILKWFMRKLEIFGSFKFACAILKLLIAF